jgi:hypothetical protein
MREQAEEHSLFSPFAREMNIMHMRAHTHAHAFMGIHFMYACIHGDSRVCHYSHCMQTFLNVECDFIQTTIQPEALDIVG